MKVKSRVRYSKIEYTRRHGNSLLGTQFKYREQMRHSVEIKEAVKYLGER